ncbi:MAG: oligosaccharide flippase family protein [Bacilli bacterium]|nr:oligosaccharide flippase family protein [Bacilli bacterium]
MKKNQRKSGAVLSYVSIIANTVVQMVYTPFMLRMLGQSEYGLYSLASSVIGYLTVLDLGFGNAIVVYSAKYRAKNETEKEKKMLGMFKIIFYIIGLIVALFSLLLFFNAENMFGKTMSDVELSKIKIMMLILSFNLVVTFAFSIYSSIIVSREKFVFQKLMSILNTILKPVLMIPLLFLGCKSVGMSLVITFINLVVIFSNYLYCRNELHVKVKYSGFDKIVFKTMFGYSIWIFLATIVDKVNWSVDHFILGMVSGTVAVSIYSIAAHLNTIFVNLSTAISGVLLPKMSKMVAKNATSEELTDEMIKVGRIQYYVIFFMASSLVLFGKEFIIWWAGKEYSDAYYVALILIIPLCFPLIQNLGISIMQAMNKFKFKAISTAIMAVFNVIMSYYLAKHFGPIGSAIGTAIALVVCNIILINIYYKKSIGLNVLRFWKDILKMTITFIFPLVLILIVMHVVKLNGFPSFVVYGILYGIMYLNVCYNVTMNNYEKNVVDKVLKKLHLKKKVV